VLVLLFYDVDVTRCNSSSFFVFNHFKIEVRFVMFACLT
jgi:hypothetical protein